VPSTSHPIPFHRVAIVGTGLIGGSFGLALRKQFPEIEITGYDRPEAVARALAKGAITRGSADLAGAVREANLIYIALPIGGTIESLAGIAAVASKNALVTDAASTKEVICRAAGQHFASGARFLGGHPMAGKETSGVEHATAELFQGSRYALITTESDSDARVKAFASLVREIGAATVWCDAETHDWAVGAVSHLPQMVAIALARVVCDETDETGLPVTLAGPGLKDMLRIAGSSYGLWRDIALTNTENITRSLDRMTQAIEFLRTRLTSKELGEEFAAANELYKLLKQPR
jgi:prephenate dehydrogenase